MSNAYIVCMPDTYDPHVPSFPTLCMLCGEEIHCSFKTLQDFRELHPEQQPMYACIECWSQDPMRGENIEEPGEHTLREIADEHGWSMEETVKRVQAALEIIRGSSV